MYTVLIADDEKIERDGIRCLLKREKKEYHILEAVNGKEAETVLKEQSVDILLTDVKMPYLTGLELTEEAVELQPGIQVIIFSGFQSFEFARTAIKYGVNDYILKPVDPDELYKALNHAEENIRLRAEHLQVNKHSSKYLEQYFMLQYILRNQKSILDEAKSYVDVSKWDSYHHAIFVECGNDFFERYADEFQKDFSDLFEERALYLNMNTCQGLLLLKDNLEDPFEDSYRRAVKLLEWLKRTYHKEFFLAASTRCKSFEEMPDTYYRLEELMEEKFYHTQRHIFCETVKNTGDSLIYEGQIIRMLEKDIREKDAIHLETHFKKVVDRYSGCRFFPSMYVKFIFSNIVKELWDCMAGYQDDSINQIIDRLYQSKKVSDVIVIAQEQVNLFLQYIAEDKGSRKFKVDVTKEYIAKHYGEELDLEKLAKRVNLSSGHLSKIFKKETGDNLMQYIKNVRLEKAKKMTIETTLTIHEICKKSGFNNLSYFCKRFREQYGDTPDNYRRKVWLEHSGKVAQV